MSAAWLASEQASTAGGGADVPCCWPDRFCDTHNFEKPNDKRGLDLMDECAKVNASLYLIMGVWAVEAVYISLWPCNTQLLGGEVLPRKRRVHGCPLVASSMNITAQHGSPTISKQELDNTSFLGEHHLLEVPTSSTSSRRLVLLHANQCAVE